MFKIELRDLLGEQMSEPPKTLLVFRSSWMMVCKAVIWNELFEECRKYSI